jgi:hypothetical protein
MAEPPHPKTPRGILIALLILLLPFFFFSWMLPFISKTKLGNDYSLFALPQQMELQFSIKNGSFPLFVPGFAGGQSAVALTQGQLYHPISQLVARMPGYWSGFAGEWNSLFRLLSLGLANLAVYFFLRRLCLARPWAFLVSVVTVYNLRMLDLFRYGASLESWTGHLFLCASIGLYYVMPSRLWGRAAIIASTYWLVTSGHPQMSYYGAVGAAMFVLLVPLVGAAVRPGEEWRLSKLVRFWLEMAICCLVGTLLAFPFLAPFYSEFLATNVRTTSSFFWATRFGDSILGTLNSFFFPLQSDVHGAFGGSALILPVALVPLLSLFRRRIPAGIWLAWALVLLVFLCLLGERTLVYYLVWKYLPLISSLRIAGRMSMLLPMPIMLVLAWLLAQPQVPEPKPRLHNGAILGCLGLVIFCVYALVLAIRPWSPSLFSPVSIRAIPSWVGVASLVLGLATLILMVLASQLRHHEKTILAGLGLCVCAQTKITLDHGTWTATKLDSVTSSMMANWKKEKLDYRFIAGESMFSKSVWRQVSEFHLEPFLGKVYFKCKTARDEDDAYRILRDGVAPDEVVVEGQATTRICQDSPSNATAAVSLVYSSLNRLVFTVDSSQPGLFGFGHPYSGHWRSMVDGFAVPVWRANGGSHAVPIPSGRSRVEFRYQSPASLFGFVMSGVVFILTGFFLVMQSFGKKSALAVGAVLSLASLAFFLLLNRSLYSGQNLETAYAWSTPVVTDARPNLAYGRVTRMISILNAKDDYCTSAGSKGTDGDRSPLSGFKTDFQPSPSWGVDLNALKRIGSIVLYESRKNRSWNQRPIEVATSSDGEMWSKIEEAFTDGGGTLTLNLSKPVTARFVAIKATGPCRLSFDEVEIFPADE